MSIPKHNTPPGRFHQTRRWPLQAWFTLACLTLAGCGEQFPNEKPVYAVKGMVLVDGKPQEGIRVTLHDDAGVDIHQPTFPTAFTAADGSLVISTYSAGDGAPAGDYHLTFLWGQLNPMSMSYGGPDKLNGRYADVEASEIVLHVSEGGENDLGVVELTTQ